MNAAERQLGLPLVVPRPSGAGVFGVAIGRLLHITVQYGDGEVGLRIDAARGGKMFDVRLVLRGDPCCWVNGRPHAAAWPLWQGVPMFASYAADPFRSALAFAYLHIIRPAVGQGGRERARTLMRQVWEAARRVAIRAAEMCVVSARTAALRFCAAARFFIYRHIVRDPSGRVAQAAAACPGLILLAAAFDRRRVDNDLIEQVIAGRKLSAVIGEGVDLWLAGADTNPRLSSRPLEDRDEQRKRQHLLVRRAASTVPLEVLWAPPPIELCPDHIPSAVRDNGTWYRAVKSVEGFVGADGVHDEATRRAACRFVSKNAVALWRLGGGARSLQATSSLILGWSAARGRPVGRSAGASKTVDAARKWRCDLDRLLEVRASLPIEQQCAVGAPRAILGAAFPSPPFGLIRTSAIVATPLRTVGELLHEGDEMRHCGATRARAVFGGRSYVYAVRANGVRLTAEVRRILGQWKLHELKGFANEAPTEGVWRQLSVAFDAARSGAREQLVLSATSPPES